MNLVEQLLSGAKPDDGFVLEALDRNEGILFETIGTLTNAVRERINQNSDAIERVHNRITSSLNGHIRKNLGLLKPIVENLYSAVHTGIAETQAGLNHVIARPEIQDWLRRHPPNPPWDGVVPAPPLPGELSGVSNVLQSAPGAPATGKKLTTYYLWYSCQEKSAIAVPNITAKQMDDLMAEGWQLWPGNATIRVESEAVAQQYLVSQRAKLARLCAGQA